MIERSSWIQNIYILYNIIYVLRKIIEKRSFRIFMAYGPNLIDFGPLISQISIFLDETNFICQK